MKLHKKTKTFRKKKMNQNRDGKLRCFLLLNLIGLKKVLQQAR